MNSDENILRIEYRNGRGKMKIWMEGFFPCSQKRFKELLKVINMDYDHRREHKEKIRAYLEYEDFLLDAIYKRKIKQLKGYFYNPKIQKEIATEADKILKRKKKIEKNKAFFEKAVNI